MGRRLLQFARRSFPTLSIFAALGFAGLAAALWGARYPQFTDAAAAEIALASACADSATYDPDWSMKLDALRTPGEAWINAGTGLVEAALCLALLYAALEMTRVEGCAVWRTPKRRRTFIGIVVGTLLLLWTAGLVAIQLEIGRGAIVECVYSMNVPFLPLGFTTSFIEDVAVPAAVASALVLPAGKLPAPLLQWDLSRPTLSWCVSLAAAAYAALLLVALVHSLPTTGYNFVPGLIWALYLTMSLRAALLAPVRSNS